MNQCATTFNKMRDSVIRYNLMTDKIKTERKAEVGIVVNNPDSTTNLVKWLSSKDDQQSKAKIIYQLLMVNVNNIQLFKP
jgi:hypothetical protein